MSAAGNIDVSIEHKRSDPAERDGAGHPNTCPGCGSHYRDDELAEHLRVCPQCGHHFPVRAPERIAQLADPGTFEEEVRGLIERALTHAGGRVYGPGGAASLLGLRPTTLQGKMKKYGVAPPRGRG